MEFENSTRLSDHRQGTSGAGGSKHPWKPHGNAKANQFAYLTRSPFTLFGHFLLTAPSNEDSLTLTKVITAFQSRPVFDKIVIALMERDPSKVVAHYFTSDNKKASCAYPIHFCNLKALNWPRFNLTPYTCRQQTQWTRRHGSTPCDV